MSPKLSTSPSSRRRLSTPGLFRSHLPFPQFFLLIALPGLFPHPVSLLCAIIVVPFGFVSCGPEGGYSRFSSKFCSPFPSRASHNFFVSSWSSSESLLFYALQPFQLFFLTPHLFPKHLFSRSSSCALQLLHPAQGLPPDSSVFSHATMILRPRFPSVPQFSSFLFYLMERARFFSSGCPMLVGCPPSYLLLPRNISPAV